MSPTIPVPAPPALGQLPPALVTFTGVRCQYGPNVVLDAVDLTIRGGEFIGIVGPSGAGKTTLLRALLGAVTPTRGSIDVAPGARLGYVPQVETVNWNFPVTVAEAVLMARTSGRRVPWRSDAERAEVAAVLERLQIGDFADRHIRALSGGQQQRVFIARALLSRPDVLVMDEPTSGVDVRTRHDVLHLLEELNTEGLTIVLSTHDLNGIAAHLPRLVCVNKTITGQGPPEVALTPDVLERTYGAPMDVLEHAGLRLVVDRPFADRPFAGRKGA